LSPDPSFQMTASAFGSLKPVKVQNRMISEEFRGKPTVRQPTCQIEEIGLLAIFMEDTRRAVLHFRGREYSNCSLGELVGESRSAQGIFKGRDSGCHYATISLQKII
jgi:hypothetical protein